MISKRLLHSTVLKQSKFDPNYKFKCGLEVHTQLKTKYKLFSLSPTSFNASPNSKISYFDIGIPGTQPKLNPEALLLALKLSAALDCDIQSMSRFDRKHYFYPDQPLGYQITQFYHPLAKYGKFKLSKQFDNLPEDKVINIRQIQIEQDTGKLVHNKHDESIKIDFNRANIPLIELITDPDFENLSQIKSFLKKYQLLTKRLDVCSGDLETGAMRVDVNVSVNGGNRVEIKNLGSSSEIQEAIVFEYARQVDEIKKGNTIEQETRGWNGKETVRRRSKEDAVDYRYFPDSELPIINLDPAIKAELISKLPKMPDQLLEDLTSEPYNLEMKHARFLLQNDELFDVYNTLFDEVVNKRQILVKSVNNWVIHELLGAFNRLNVSFNPKIVGASTLATLITEVFKENITLTAARTVLVELIKSPESTVEGIIVKHGLGQPKDVSASDLDDAITEVCKEVISKNPDVVAKVKDGKKKSINFLLGQAMKLTQGKVSSKDLLAKLNQLI